MFQRLVLCLALLAACSPAVTEPPVADSRTAPTAPPPAWVESADVVTLANVADIRYLGRMDGLGTPSTIFAHAFSPDGTHLAALDNEQLLVWNLIDGKVVFGTGRGETNQVFYSPDKTEVYTVTAGGNVSIYDAERGTPQNSFQLSENFNGVVSFYPEDGWLVGGNLRGQARIWDPLERRALATIDAHALQIRALAFSPDGTRLATVGEEGTVKVWDWRSRQIVATFEDDTAALVLRFSPDGTQLAAGNGENTRLWSVVGGSLERIIDTGPGGVDALLYSPDGKYLLSGGTVANMSIWDPATGNLVARLPGVGGDRVSAAFSPDGTLLVTCVLGKQPSLWNMNEINGQTVSRADLDTQGNLVLSVDWTPDSRLITLFGVTSGVYVWGIGPETE